MKKKPKITTLTRKKLMTSFWMLYCEKKIEKISMKEITDQAGYYRSTFYEYFIDIYDVLDQLETELIDYLKENVQSTLTMKQNKDIIKILATMYASKGEYLSVLLGENGDPDFNRKLKDSLRPMIFEALGLSKNEIHNQFIFEFAISAIIYTIKYWYDKGKSISNEELAIMIQSMLSNGVTPMISEHSNFNIIN